MKKVGLFGLTVVALLGTCLDAKAQQSVAVTITTVPAGLTISVDGTNYIAPASFDWLSDSSHTLIAASPQTAADGHSRYVFAAWSDGGPQTNVITVPSSPTNYTATFSTQYLLDVAVTPADVGTVTNNPAGPWYDAGQLVSLTAVTNAGYRFLFWTGVLDSQTSNTAKVTMNGYRSTVATFATSTSKPAPQITVNLRNNPTPGNILMATWDRNTPHIYDNYLFVLDNQGNILNAKRVNGAPFDFQQQPNGQYSYAEGDYAGIAPTPTEPLTHYVLDANLSVVDSFQMKHGYQTDFHEFLLEPNGHAVMMSYHTTTFDMSTVVPGGKPNCQLIVNIIQEQDAAKHPVFEWRNIDHIPITDSDLPLTDARINYSTLNAYELDNDGNYLASFRNHSEIMKISRTTGEVLWRWGSPRSQFTFVGEHAANAPNYFARQHDIRRLPNGNVTLFDNGDFHSPSYSRCVEYQLDEVNRVATMVSEYRYPTGNIFAAAAGSAQPLPNGGWFSDYGILFGASPVKRQIVESRADGTNAFELSLPNNVIAYRARKLFENTTPIIVSRSGLVAGQTYLFNDAAAVTGVSLQIQTLAGTGDAGAVVQREPFAPIRPTFPGNAPRVLPVRVAITGSQITSLTADVLFDAASFGFADKNGVFGYVDPNALTVYRRPAGGGVDFVPLATLYDSGTKQLRADTTELGEFILCFPDAAEIPNLPILVAPVDGSFVNQELPVKFLWTPRGFARASHLQVARDTNFTDLVVDAPVLSEYQYSWSSASPSTNYFYRVRISNAGGQSGWSTASFKTIPPRILITSPNGNEGWVRGLKYFIRWNANIAERVVIDLYRAGAFVKTIVTTDNTGAYEWEADLTQAAASDYSIKVRSSTNAAVFDDSDAAFALVAAGDPAINQAPKFTGYAVNATSGQPLSLNLTKILAHASDPDGDAVSLTQVFGPSFHGGTVALADSVTYTPPSDYIGTDTFEVKLTDEHGANMRGIVTATVSAAATGAGQNQTSFAMIDGKAVMVFRGIPGRSYLIQRSSDLIIWIDLGTASAGADGKITFTDPSPPVPQGFYRTQSN